LNGTNYPLKDNSVIVIPPGTEHNIINNSDTDTLKLYTIYSPPEHEPDTFQPTKPIESNKKGGFNKKLYECSRKDYFSLCE
jgi:oxalate decarboxylase/phosphoglucose isomerase-like protein (cupin superfamily)